jgi:hypothetical protein
MARQNLSWDETDNDKCRWSRLRSQSALDPHSITTESFTRYKSPSTCMYVCMYVQECRTWRLCTDVRMTQWRRRRSSLDETRDGVSESLGMLVVMTAASRLLFPLLVT